MKARPSVLWVPTLTAALMFAGWAAVSAQESEPDCPRPVSSTCFVPVPKEVPSLPREEPRFPEIHLEVLNTTYVYNVESQGTFVQRKACQGFFCFRGEEEINGFTLFGDFTALQLRYSPASNVHLYGGVFFAIPFGGEDTVETVRPVLALVYRPVEGVHFLAGTLQPRHRFHDAVFDDLMYFIRPVEQGFQLLVDRRYYQQDLFINWQQQNTRVTNERFDIGYVGKLQFGFLRLNLQGHYDHLGGEVPFPDFRPLEARNNLAWAVGPELAFSPSRYFPSLSAWREVGVALTFLGTSDQPNSRTPEFSTKGHAHELRGWVDLLGWRVEASRWRSDSFVASNGDRFFGVSDLTEVSLAKLFPLVRQVVLEFGGLVRFIKTKSVVPEFNDVPASIVYAAAHWNMDFDLGPVLKRQP